MFMSVDLPDPMAHDGQELAALDVQVHVPQSRHGDVAGAVDLGDAPQADHGPPPIAMPPPSGGPPSNWKEGPPVSVVVWLDVAVRLGTITV
jgi:hypothetical protein